MADTTESDEIIEHFCGPCKLDHKRLSPIGYCKTCNDYLCNTCYLNHRLPLQMRSHMLLNKDEMPTGHQPLYVSVSTQICSDICEEHSQERLTFYCGTHDAVCCSVCMMKNHRRCENLEYIPEMNIKTKQDFGIYQRKLAALTRELKENIEKSTKSVETVKTMYSEARKAANKFRKDLVEYIDKLFSDFDNTTQEMEKAQIKKLNDACYNSRDKKRCTESLREKLNEFDKTGSNMKLYTAMKKSKKFIKETEEQLVVDKEVNHIKHCYFEPEQQLRDFSKNIHVLGLMKDIRTSV